MFWQSHPFLDFSKVRSRSGMGIPMAIHICALVGSKYRRILSTLRDPLKRRRSISSLNDNAKRLRFVSASFVPTVASTLLSCFLAPCTTTGRMRPWASVAEAKTASMASLCVSSPRSNETAKEFRSARVFRRLAGCCRRMSASPAQCLMMLRACALNTSETPRP